MLTKKIFFVLLSFPLFAIPPPEPGAGVIEREIQQEYESKPLELEKDIPSVEIDLPEEKLEMPPGKRISIRSVRIEDNHVISRDEILSWISNFSSGDLTLLEIYKLCKRIDQNYAERGYFLARSYPPPQEVHEGVLTIRILEGRIGNIRIEGNKRYNSQFICRYFKPFCHQAIQYDRFLKALLLLNENLDLSAGVLFEKGEEVGTADLVVRVADARPIHFYVNENNFGRNLTTNSQLGARLDWGNFFFNGDKLSLAEVVGFPLEALYFTDVSLKIPLNTSGLFMQLAYLFSRFEIEEMRSLRLSGKSDIGTLKFTQAMRRTKTCAVDLFGYFDYKQIQNLAMEKNVSYDRLRVLTGGLLFDHYNSAQGRDYLNIRLAVGLPHFLGGMGSHTSQSSRVGGGGKFLIFNLDYDRIQQIYKEYLLYFHVSGQWSPDKLTLPEQLYIGGSNTVRGYPLSVTLGDSGYYFNLEARIPPPFISNIRFLRTKKKWKDAVQLVGFLDTGATFLHKGNQTYITGAGFGIRVTGPSTFSLSFDLGFPLQRTQDLGSGTFNYLKLTAQLF